MDDLVVVKTLVREEMGRDADQSFAEARVLRKLHHPAIIGTLDADYMDHEGKATAMAVQVKPGATSAKAGQPAEKK